MSLLMSLLMSGICGMASPALGQSDTAVAKPRSSPVTFPVFLTASLRDGLDTTVSPCADFDQFINGGWRARTAIPQGTEHIDVFTATFNDTKKLLRVLLDSARHVATTTTDADMRAVGTYYESCLLADSLSNVMQIRTMFGVPPYDSTRAARCQRLVMNDLPDALGQIFVRLALSPATEARALQLVNEIRAAAATRLSRISWVSADAKLRAKAALDRMTLKVAKLERTVDHGKLVLTRSDLEANQREIQSYLGLNKLLSRYDERPAWNQSQYNPNASYQPNSNSIEVPSSMFQEPLFSLTAEPAVMYVGAGMVLGHEIFHAITYNLKATEADGFHVHTRRLAEQYGRIPPKEDVRVNGSLTVNENLADLGGLLVAYDAWRTTSRKTAKREIEGFTPEQRFFVHYARTWRMKASKTFLSTQAVRDPHAPGWARINGVLKNMPAFAKAFGCKDGDPMVNRESDRVVLW